MATALTTKLGTSEIKVGIEPAQMQRVYHAFPGVDGLTVMNMGFRGYAVPIVGKIRLTGQANYTAARNAANVAIASLTALQSLAAADYTYYNTTYYDAIFENFRVIPDSRGMVYRWFPNGVMTVDFAITLRGLT